jgi:hypothetical protein
MLTVIGGIHLEDEALLVKTLNQRYQYNQIASISHYSQKKITPHD